MKVKTQLVNHVSTQERNCTILLLLLLYLGEGDKPETVQSQHTPKMQPLVRTCIKTMHPNIANAA